MGSKAKMMERIESEPIRKCCGTSRKEWEPHKSDCPHANQYGGKTYPHGTIINIIRSERCWTGEMLLLGMRMTTKGRTRKELLQNLDRLADPFLGKPKEPVEPEPF